MALPLPPNSLHALPGQTATGAPPQNTTDPLGGLTVSGVAQAVLDALPTAGPPQNTLDALPNQTTSGLPQNTLDALPIAAAPVVVFIRPTVGGATNGVWGVAPGGANKGTVLADQDDATFIQSGAFAPTEQRVSITGGNTLHHGQSVYINVRIGKQNIGSFPDPALIVQLRTSLTNPDGSDIFYTWNMPLAGIADLPAYATITDAALPGAVVDNLIAINSFVIGFINFVGNTGVYNVPEFFIEGL